MNVAAVNPFSERLGAVRVGISNALDNLRPGIVHAEDDTALTGAMRAAAESVILGRDVRSALATKLPQTAYESARTAVDDLNAAAQLLSAASPDPVKAAARLRTADHRLEEAVKWADDPDLYDNGASATYRQVEWGRTYETGDPWSARPSGAARGVSGVADGVAALPDFSAQIDVLIGDGSTTIKGIFVPLETRSAPTAPEAMDLAKSLSKEEPRGIFVAHESDSGWAATRLQLRPRDDYREILQENNVPENDIAELLQGRDLRLSSVEEPGGAIAIYQGGLKFF